MKRLVALPFLVATLISPPFRAAASAPGDANVLWYAQPAKVWSEALPVGSGRLGAMVFGGTAREQVQFNECTVWTGFPREYQREGAVKFLPKIRDLLQQMRAAEREAARLESAGNRSEAGAKRAEARARQKEAESLAGREFMGDPMRQMAFQPCGDLRLEFPGHEDATDYRRWLDLDSALAVTEYNSGGTLFRRELFASFPDQVIALRVTANQPGRLNSILRLDSAHRSARTTVVDGNTLVLTGTVQTNGARFECRALVTVEGGTLQPDGDVLRVTNANALWVRLIAASNFKNYRDISANPTSRATDALKRLKKRSWADLRAAQKADHETLFGRVSIDLGRTPAATNPTDQRLREFATGNDPALAALVMQYGRYLLIGSSRAGSEPANLQGVWNDSLRPPWDSKYTCNINTEMNYWPAELENLGECAGPLFDAIDQMVESGRKTARAHYGARGWVLHHNFDLWRGTAPINASDHGIWVTGGAWLCQHLWEHYLFTGDRKFLEKRAYPAMKAACEFFQDFLMPDPITGFLISGPSNSPEQGGLVMGPTMDHQIIRSLFANTAEAARVLRRDAKFAAELDALRGKIAPNMVGKHGQLQEWLEDKDDPKNQHRHVSHLWGAHPGWDITWQEPKFFHAARQSLIYRGDAATGWSMGWKVNLWARFLDGDHAMIILRNLLAPVGPRGKGGLYPNLFDAHPPFQIDGNFGASAGIAEMLLQSQVRDRDGNFIVHLLPALPKDWPAGRVSGLRARGAVTVNLDWKDGKLVAAKLRADHGGKFSVRLGEQTRPVELMRGKELILGGDLQAR
jgi:alpha-L-fucosidase 2